jgi:hypothetical protein
MSLPRFVHIEGRRYLWRDLVALRRAQAQPPAAQPTLFELREDHRPAGECTAAERYREPSLFTTIGRD